METLKKHFGAKGTARCACAVLVFLILAAATVAHTENVVTTKASIETQKNLVVKKRMGDKFFAGDEVFKMAGFSYLYDIDGKIVLEIPKDSLVNVKYYTGGKRTEIYPFDPAQKVLIEVRQISKPKDQK